MFKRIFLFVLCLPFVITSSLGQPPHTFTQYTSENGLSQKTVQNIMQDHKGLMWFTTWDGLYKFDGYTFKNYKAHPGDNIELSNNRLEYIKEDCYGYIWIQSYDHKVYRFNPVTEQFQSIPYESYSAQNIYVLPTGSIWITTIHNDLLHITTNPQNHTLTVTDFFKSQQISSPGKVNNIYLDRQQNQWILTEQGIYSFNANSQKKQVTSFFTSLSPQNSTPFYDAIENENSIYFSSQKGKIWQFHNGNFTSDSLPIRSSIRFIRQLAKGNLFVGTDYDGFFIYNTKTGKYKQYNRERHKGLKDNEIKDIYIDSHRHVWIRTSIPGITHFNPFNEKIDHFILQDKYGKDITESRMEINVYEDINGSTWIHPAGGGFAWYNRKENRLIPFYNPILQTGWSSENRVASAFTDKQGNLWLCSFGNGLEKITFNTSLFHLLPIRPHDLEYAGNNIRAIFQDSNGNIWVGSKDKIIRVYDKKLRYLGSLTSQGTISLNSTEELGMAYSFFEDHEGTIWIGTKGKGLIAARCQHTASLKFQLYHYMADDKDLYSLSGNEIYSLYEDTNQRLWIATFEGGVNYLDLKTAMRFPRFINHRNQLKNYPITQCYRTRFITGDELGNIWIGSSAGLLMCNNPNSNPEEIKFRHFSRIPEDIHSLSNNDVHSIFFSKNKEMYVATFGGGFNKLISLENEEVKFQPYTTKDGLSSDILLSIEEDTKGNLWLATEEDLCKFNPVTEKFTIYQAKSFPVHTNFNEGAALHTQDGKFIFNTGKGMLYFSPDSINNSNYIPPIILTQFQQTEDTPDTQSRKILTNNIDDTQSIELPHNQNSFNIQFAALDMKYPNNISYAYKLEGFEKKWNYIGHQRTATYTNLPKGNYNLKIKSTNSDGIWVENTRTLNITVLPSFWETPWAYLLYISGIILIILTASYILFTIFRLKHKVTVEQQISDIKLRFFTNISHELRTPLTLIAGPIEHVLQNGNLNNEEKEQLILVERNTHRMLRLVNQILDFRKIQNKKMKMRVQQIDLIPFTRHIMENFDSMADEHQIDFKLICQPTSLYIWADADKLEKILFNLLSNAFKYTPQGKEIKITIQESEKDVTVSVEDQGVGIAENKQKALFTRFENLVDKNLFNQSSTGIGLSLVKELIDMHHGKIDFYSKPGEGSSFTIHLLKGKEHYDISTEFIISDQAVTSINETYANGTLSLINEDTNNSISTDKETLLIVEDNVELRFFLRTIFISYFNVIEATNGNSGIEKSKQFLPDIIICDVMMPQKDGIEMLQELREEITTSHIPIVLLTAKSTIESKLAGMKFGADDYITKPFSATFLKARIFNLLEQRKKLQALYCASLQPSIQAQIEQQTELPTAPKLSPNDQKFMDTILSFINKHLDNGDLMVEDIAKEANMSRSVFFKKLKTLTGLSPIEFLKDIRIKNAAELIKKNEYNMAQIAYMVGFNDSHYFSKCFKQQYGITPTEYKDKWLK